MWPLVAATLVGAWLGRRGRPATSHVKRSCIGPRTGLVYAVEEFPDAGILMFTRPNCLKAVLKRSKDGLIIDRAQGTPEAIRHLERDYGQEKAP